MNGITPLSAFTLGALTGMWALVFMMYLIWYIEERRKAKHSFIQDRIDLLAPFAEYEFRLLHKHAGGKLHLNNPEVHHGYPACGVFKVHWHVVQIVPGTDLPYLWPFVCKKCKKQLLDGRVIFGVKGDK